MKSWSNAERIGFALLGVGVLSSLSVSVSPWFDLRNDASLYVIMARNIAAGDGYTYLGAPFQIRPPGLSLLLASLISAGWDSFYVFNLLVSAFGAAGVLLLYLHQRSRVAWPISLLTSLVVWLSPSYQRFCNQVMSDVPGLTLALSCLLIERWASRESSRGREIALGVTIGLAMQLRSAAVLLIPAIAISRAWIRYANGSALSRSFAIREIATFALVAFLTMTPWLVRNAIHPLPAPADQTLNYSIGTAMWRRDPGDPESPRYSVSEILKRPLRYQQDILDVLGSRMTFRVPGSRSRPEFGTHVVNGVIALIGIASLVAVLFKRRAPAELFALGSFALVCFYFSFTDRLLLPVFVLGLAAVVEAAHDLVEYAAGRRAALFLVPLLLLVLIGVDLDPRAGLDESKRRHFEHARIAQHIEAQLADDARIGSWEGFHFSVQLNRPVYNLAYAIRRMNMQDAVEGTIDKYDLNTIVLMERGGSAPGLIPYLTKNYGRGVRAGPTVLWRVRP